MKRVSTARFACPEPVEGACPEPVEGRRFFCIGHFRTFSDIQERRMNAEARSRTENQGIFAFFTPSPCHHVTLSCLKRDVLEHHSPTAARTISASINTLGAVKSAAEMSKSLAAAVPQTTIGASGAFTHYSAIRHP
jgi:hypothetical protein